MVRRAVGGMDAEVQPAGGIDAAVCTCRQRLAGGRALELWLSIGRGRTRGVNLAWDWSGRQRRPLWASLSLLRVLLSRPLPLWGCRVKTLSWFSLRPWRMAAVLIVAVLTGVVILEAPLPNLLSSSWCRLIHPLAAAHKLLQVGHIGGP